MDVIDLTGDSSPEAVHVAKKRRVHQDATEELLRRIFVSSELVLVPLSPHDRVLYHEVQYIAQRVYTALKCTQQRLLRSHLDMILAPLLTLGSGTHVDPETHFLHMGADCTLSSSQPPLSECPICLDLITSGSMTPCGHLFCTQCLTDCIQTVPQCPLCRSSITRDTLEPITTFQSQCTQFRHTSKLEFLATYIASVPKPTRCIVVCLLPDAVPRVRIHVPDTIPVVAVQDLEDVTDTTRCICIDPMVLVPLAQLSRLGQVTLLAYRSTLESEMHGASWLRAVLRFQNNNGTPLCEHLFGSVSVHL